MAESEDRPAVAETETLPPLATRIADRILDRYVAVWLWSVLFGTTVGLAYSFLNYRGERWGILSLLPASLVLVGEVIVVVALAAQVRFLTGFLLRVFFGRYDQAVGEPDPQRAATLLARSTRWLLYGFLVRGVLAIVETALGALRSLD